MIKRLLISLALIACLVSGASAAQDQDKAFAINTFDGLSTKLIPRDLPESSADTCDNARFDRVGSVSKRLTRAKYNATSLGTGSIDYLDRIYIGSNSYLLAVHRTILKVGDDAAGTFSNLKTGLTSDLSYRGVTYKGFHYIFNGTDNNIRTDGTTAGTSDMGVQVPTTNPTLTATAGGLTGAYTYYVTFVYDDYQESNGSSGASITLTSQDCILTNIPVGATGTGVTSRELYRLGGTNTVARLVTTLDDNTTTTYTDSKADASLTDFIPIDNGIPPISKYGILYRDRIFLAGDPDYPSRLSYSKILGITSYPDVYRAQNYFDIAENDGDVITGLAVDPLGLLTIFKKNKIYKLLTSLGSDVQWGVDGPYAFYGAVAPLSITETPHGIIFLGRSGESKWELRIFDGRSTKAISERIEPTLNALGQTYLEDAIGTFHNNKFMFAYNDISDAVDYNNRLLILDMVRDTYTIDTGKNINYFSPWNGGTDVGQLYTGDSFEGFVYREDTDDFDIIIDTKSELDSGVYSQEESSGTEADPEVKLILADLPDDFGAINYEDLTVNDYEDITGDNQTYWPSGSLISPVLEINANSLLTIAWSETLGAGDVQFWVRTGNTTALTEAASWEGPYTDPTGSDISAVTARKYIQYKSKLYTNDYTVVTTPKLVLSGGYVVKIVAGFGTTAETTIPFNYRTGELDFGYPANNKVYKQIRLNYSSASTGTLNLYYSIDSKTEVNFAVDLATYPTSCKFNFPANKNTGERIRLRMAESSTNALRIDNVYVIYQLEPLKF